MRGAYYNEIDPYCAQWLRNLIAAGHIAPGDVDERSIRDVRPDDVRGYVQCHFFAGIGIWSAALRQAGWDARPVWTGSCPCQSFSAAGKGLGTRDERHLWPEWFRLIRDCRPLTIFGEQIASKDGLAWLDIVCADLENAGYPVWPVDLCAAGVGAPHIRQRLWFVAYTECGATERWRHDMAGSAPRTQDQAQKRERVRIDAGASGKPCFLAHADGGNAGTEGLQRGEQHGQQQEDGRSVRMADPAIIGHDGRRPSQAMPHAGTVQEPERFRDVNGFWADADWIACSDGKARPVEPGTFPLAHGHTGRVGKLRAYGNAICLPVAVEFIRAAAECIGASLPGNAQAGRG